MRRPKAACYSYYHLHSAMFRFFDRLEDRIRMRLSRYPVLYSFIGGVGIVLFWRGVWHTADLFPFMTGPVSVAISVVLLLLTGLFVSFFVGDAIVMSGIQGEKKLIEKTESELKHEASLLKHVEDEVTEERHLLRQIKHELSEVKTRLDRLEPRS